MSERNQDMTRRRFLKLSAATLTLPAATLIASDRASAQGKAKQEAVQYQDTPKNGQKCVDCVLFEPPEGCKVVEGKISPEGWCSLFAPKPS